jgi:dipeptidyl aminopeptidase/acylaminoacyl peptidase
MRKQRFFAYISAVSVLMLLTCDTVIFPYSTDLPSLIPRETLFNLPQRTKPRISPDGRKLAYLAPENGVLRVWMRTLGQTDDQVVTSNDTSPNFLGFYWQADSEHLLYYSDHDGDEKAHLYQTNVRTKAIRDLTPANASIEFFTPPMFSRKFPDQVIVAVYKRDPENADLYRINLNTGAAALFAKNPGTIDPLNWKLDDAFERQVAIWPLADGSSEVRLRNNLRSKWRTLIKWSRDDTSDVTNTILDFTPDHRAVRALSLAKANSVHLIEIKLQTGRVKILAEDPQYDVTDTLIDPITHQLEAVEVYRQRSEWKALDKSIQPDLDVLRSLRDCDFSLSSRDDANRKWIISYQPSDGPTYFYLYKRDTKKASLLFSNRPDLERYHLTKMLPVEFKARDGLVIHGYLTLPPGLSAKKLPMVIYAHGGPDSRTTWQFDPVIQFLTNRGYAVFNIDFRGSTGYGKRFYNAGIGEWGGRMSEDLIDGKKWAVGQGYADPNRVCLMGDSYGGYATLVGLTSTPNEFACGIDLYGPSNLVAIIRSFPYATAKAELIKRIGGDPETQQGVAFLKSRSPLFKAGQIRVPLLIAQGANDPRVPKEESDQIVAAIRKRGGDIEYMLFDNEGHGLTKPENRRRFYAVVEQFLAKYLGGRSESLNQERKEIH